MFETLLTLIAAVFDGNVSALILLAPLPMTLLITLGVVLHVFRPYDYRTGKCSWSVKSVEYDLLVVLVPVLAIMYGCCYALLSTVGTYGI